MTPAMTATAKSCQTVMALTAIKTKASATGILAMILKLDHAMCQLPHKHDTHKGGYEYAQSKVLQRG